MCYSSPPVYKVQPDPAIFAYHRDFQSSSRSLTKVRVRLLQTLPLTCPAVEFEQINTSAQSLRGTKAYFEQILPKDLKRLSGRMRLSLIKSVSEQARARVHTYHQKIVYVNMLQREESRSLPNNSKSFLYHRPKTSKSEMRSDNFHLQMRNEVCVDNSDIFTSFNVC